MMTDESAVRAEQDFARGGDPQLAQGHDAAAQAPALTLVRSLFLRLYGLKAVLYRYRSRQGTD